MKNRQRHIQLLLLVAGIASALTGCQGRKNGLSQTDRFLNPGVNPYLYANTGGQVVGYLVYGQGVGIAPGANLNPEAGGVQTAPGQNGGTGAGGVQGASPVASGGTPCLLKVAAISPENFSVASNQNYGSMYHETGIPSSGRGVYQTGIKFPITCDRDSEIAATQTAFYATGGSTSTNFWAYRTDTNGAPLGAPTAFKIGPNTKVSASPSGHIAVITNGGQTLTLFMESRIGGDGGWIADKYHEIPAQNGALFTDVVIDDKQGGLYVGEKLPGGVGQVLVFRLDDAYNGVFRASFDSLAYLSGRATYNFEYNLPNETAVSHLFRQAMPLKLKNNNGLTGIFTAAGHPFFMETGLGLSPEETVNKTPEELQEIYKNETNLTVQDIRIFDPFQVSYHSNSTYVQPAFKYKDFAVGDNMAYLITEQGTLYTIYVSSDYQFDASTPWENRLNMGQKLNTIEMSYDGEYAIVTGDSGLSIGRKAGSNLVFNATGRPDIQETGAVIHAAGLAKINRIPLPTTDATAGAKKKKKNNS